MDDQNEIDKVFKENLIDNHNPFIGFGDSDPNRDDYNITISRMSIQERANHYKELA